MSEGNNRATLPASDLEPASSHAPVAAHETPAFNSPVNIRVTSYRKLNHDPDGISAKAVLDGVVAAGILTDDSAKQVESITFKSIKSKEEKTVIEIESV